MLCNPPAKKRSKTGVSLPATPSWLRRASTCPPLPSARGNSVKTLHGVHRDQRIVKVAHDLLETDGQPLALAGQGIGVAVIVGHAGPETGEEVIADHVQVIRRGEGRNVIHADVLGANAAVDASSSRRSWRPRLTRVPSRLSSYSR